MPETPYKYPDLPPELRGGLNWRLFSYFGAGAIIASVTIGSGETVFASRGGAVFGYALMWCFVFGAIMKCIQVYTAARYMTPPGAHPMTHWGRRPGPRNWVPIVIGLLSLVCFPFWLAGLPKMLGDFINWVFDLGQGDEQQMLKLARLWGSAAIVVAMTLTMLQTYAILERVQTVIVALLLLSVAGACLATRPDWISALVGTFVPMVPDYEDWIASEYPKIAARAPWVEVAVYLGALGGGTYDFIGYIGCLREKKWGLIGRVDNNVATSGTLSIGTDQDNLHRARRWLRAPKIDVGVSFACILFFTLCFVLLGAAILHEKHLIPAGNELLSHQATFLTGVHGSLQYVYHVGIFMAFWGTIYGAYELYTRTTYECILPLHPKLRHLPHSRVRLPVMIYVGVGGLILLWTVKEPIKMVTPAAIIGGVFACGLWCFAMIWADRHFLPRPLRMGRILLMLTTISGVVMTVMGAKAMWDYAAKWIE